jgi:hypothetical protein
MKSNLFKITIIFALLNFHFLVFDANAQSNVSPAIMTDGSNLSGSWRKPEELIAKSDAIFIGQILSLSLPDFVAAGASSYGAKVKVLQSFKGIIAAEIHVALQVTNGGPISEKKPELNHTYIFFVTIRKEDNRIEVLKLVDATDDAIAHVKQLIAAAPAPK